MLKYHHQILEKRNKILEKNLNEAQNLISDTAKNAADELEKTLQDMEDQDNIVFNEIQNKYADIIRALQTELRTSTPVRKDSHSQVNVLEIKRLTTGF